MNPRLRAWSVGVGAVPSEAGHQESSQVEGVGLRMRTSILSEFSFRRLLFIHSATAFIPAWKLVLAVAGSLVRERISWVSAYETMLRLCDQTMLASGVMYTLKSVGLKDDPWGTPQVILVASDRNGEGWTVWVLSVRKEGLHSRALSQIPAL